MNPPLGGRIQERPFEGPRLERRSSALRAREALLVALRRKDIMRMREFREPQARRLRRIGEVGDVADDVENALGHACCGLHNHAEDAIASG